MKTTISVDQLTKDVSKAAFRGEAAAFVGAGVSSPSDLPTWADLIRPMVADLGINFRNCGEDIPLMTQHLVNISAGNRGRLVAQLQEKIQRQTSKPNHYHRSIVASAIDLIWTTNYDTLLEQAYGSYPVAIRARDTDMSLVSDPDSVEIVKAHGCIARSAPCELVLTREDYEDYFVHRPLISERLRNDLQKRTFLFLGYGYGDPNIANILVEARRLAQKVPRRRYLIAKKSDPAADGNDALARQELWALDMHRIGIECALVDDYDEYQRVVKNIAIGSRGPTLYVTGAHSNSSELATQVGKLLAEQNDTEVVLYDGQSTGVSRCLIASFVQQAALQQTDYRHRIRFYSNPYSADPRLSGDPSLMPRLKEWRAPMLRKVHTVLAFDGGMGTRAEVELAVELGCRLVLVQESPDGSSAKLLQTPQIAASSDSLDCSNTDKTPSARKIVETVLASMPTWD